MSVKFGETKMQRKIILFVGCFFVPGLIGVVSLWTTLTHAQTPPGNVLQQNVLQKIANPQQQQPALQQPGRPLPVPLFNLTPEQAAANPLLNARLNSLLPEERNSVLVYENCNRGVVNINTKVMYTANMIFQIEAPDGGSGVVLDQQGHIVTNYHVIEDAHEIQVTLFNGSTYNATPVGGDPFTDLAVLKIDAPVSELFPIPLGDSGLLFTGERIYAIGNPFGLDRTYTAGIISSLNRTIGSQKRGRTIKQVIQIDAAINPGNSGGALLNTAGQLIGINTMIASSSGDSAGIGFAIPVNTLARIVPLLLKDGKIIRPDIGIYQVRSVENNGVLVALMEPDGPAAKAGILGPTLNTRRGRNLGFTYEETYIDKKKSDLIVAVNNQPVKSGEDFIALVEENRPGDTITLTVVRNGETLKIPVTLR